MEIVLPITRQGMSNLSKGIKVKVLADGIGGECHAFAIAQGINVSTDYDNTVLSVGHEADHFTKFRLGEKNNAIFHKVLDEINTVSRGIAQELKSLNAPNYKNGNDWGFDFSDNGASPFPTEIADQITLFENINTHYLTFAPGTAQIENWLLSKPYVMATLAASLAGAVTTKTTADQNHRDAKTETQSANSFMATPEINIHKFAEFLHSRHENDARTLGEYGFDTSDAPALEKAQMSGVPIGEDKQLQHIVLGSTMTNMTGDPIIVFKGRKKTGTGVTIPGHGELAMTKGYSNAIVNGTNPLKAGIVKTIIRK